MKIRLVDVIARALRERHPDYKMPELMAWDIVKRLAEAGLEIRRAIPNREATPLERTKAKHKRWIEGETPYSPHREAFEMGLRGEFPSRPLDATPNSAADVLADLRAKVEALPFDGRQIGSTPISKQAVLDMIDGTATVTPHNAAERPEGEWPAWIADVLTFGPIAELEVEWRAAIGDAMTKVLDQRKEAT